MQWSASVIDLLLRTLFNIQAATVVTLSIESYPFVFTVRSVVDSMLVAMHAGHCLLNACNLVCSFHCHTGHW